MHGMYTCAHLCMTLRGWTRLQAVFKVSWMGLGMAPGIAQLVPGDNGADNTQKPMAHCTLEWTNLSQKSRCMRNMLFFIFCNLILFHISILLEVSATNLSQFGVSSLISSSVVSQIQVETGSTQDVCLIWYYWSILLLTGSSGVILWQWSSFFKIRGSFACPLFISSHVICRHQGPHAMMLRDWTFVSGLSCHAQHSLLHCLSEALPGEVA